MRSIRKERDDGLMAVRLEVVDQAVELICCCLWETNPKSLVNKVS